MLDRSILGSSWDSLVSKDEPELEFSISSSSRTSPLKEIPNHTTPKEKIYCISRHNPNKTFRREAVIASWRNVKKEREQALGKRIVFVDKDSYEDYYGRNTVKRCKSDRTPNAPRVQRKIRRTYSVFYRYDPTSEKVIKEYKYLPNQSQIEEQKVVLHKSFSEPFLNKIDQKPKKKVKRSFTTFLNIKSKFLNIFSSKS